MFHSYIQVNKMFDVFVICDLTLQREFRFYTFLFLFVFVLFLTPWSLYNTLRRDADSIARTDCQTNVKIFNDFVLVIACEFQ